MDASFVHPDQVRLELHDGVAVVRLLVDKPDGASADGWSLASRVSLCAVNGPISAYVFPRFGLDSPDGWDAAIDSFEGAFVVFGSSADRDIFAHAL